MLESDITVEEIIEIRGRNKLRIPIKEEFVKLLELFKGQKLDENLINSISEHLVDTTLVRAIQVEFAKLADNVKSLEAGITIGFDNQLEDKSSTEIISCEDDKI